MEKLLVIIILQGIQSFVFTDLNGLDIVWNFLLMATMIYWLYNVHLFHFYVGIMNRG